MLDCRDGHHQMYQVVAILLVFVVLCGMNSLQANKTDNATQEEAGLPTARDHLPRAKRSSRAPKMWAIMQCRIFWHWHFWGYCCQKLLLDRILLSTIVDGKRFCGVSEHMYIQGHEYTFLF